MVSVIDIVRRLCTTCSYLPNLVLHHNHCGCRLPKALNSKFQILNFKLQLCRAFILPPSLECLQRGAARVKISLEAVFNPPKLVFIAFLISRLYRLAVWIFKRRYNIIQNRAAHACVVRTHTWSFRPACIVACNVHRKECIVQSMCSMVNPLPIPCAKNLPQKTQQRSVQRPKAI